MAQNKQYIVPKSISREAMFAINTMIRAMEKNGFTFHQNSLEEDMQFKHGDDVSVTICFHH